MIATVALLAAPVGAFAAEEAPSPLGGPLALGGGAEVLAPGGAQLAAEAKSSSPEAFWARESSQTAYEGLSAESPGAAGRLAGEAFPGLVDRPAAGPPALGSGEKVERFLGFSAASVLLPSGGRGVVESLGAPMAMRGARGSWAAIDMSLGAVSGGFLPRRAPSGRTVFAPKHVNDGVSLLLSGVSLTPVDEHGDALGSGEGAVQGASVFYGGVEDAAAGVRDLGVLVKPGVGSFEVSDVLFSDRSPEVLYFKVGMPAGARLQQAQGGSGAVSVVDEGSAIAVVRAPEARDAEGTPVPVSMSVEGDLLKLSVAHPMGNYRLPIAVDPEVKDAGFATEFYPTRWRFISAGAGFTAPEIPQGSSWTEHISGTHGASEWGALEYTTQGESEIVSASVEGLGTTRAPMCRTT